MRVAESGVAEEGQGIRTFEDLKVYQAGYRLAMQVFRITGGFPSCETYSMTDQMRRASRSIPANIAEGWAKRKYENVFLRHLNDAHGSCAEMRAWINMSKDCGYIEGESAAELLGDYEELGAMLCGLMKKWQKYE